MIRTSLASLALAAATLAPAQAQGQSTIFETAQAAGSFDTLVAALQATGLDAPLNAPGQFTVFAPTDGAFAALPPGTVTNLLQPPNLDTLADILEYHVVGGTFDASQVVATPFFTTLNPQRIDITIQGMSVFVDGAMITMTDIFCTNGVIHVIDAVLMPNINTTLRTAGFAGGFDTLIGAVTAFPDLAAALIGSQELTVFAPGDSAFANIPADRLGELVNNPALLREVLELHVVPGRLYADEILAAGSVTTLQGRVLPVTESNGEVFVAGVRILAADIETSNGTIHVVEEVLTF